MEAKQTLVTLATEYDRSIGLFRARQNGVEYLLGRVIAYFSEAPVGYVIAANEVTKTPMTTVDPLDPLNELNTFFDQRARLVVSCAAARASGDLVAAQACEVADQDGLSGIANCRPYNFTNYHDACQTNEPPGAAHRFIGVTQPTGPCSTNCLGGCGPGCVIGQPFTRDCAEAHLVQGLLRQTAYSTELSGASIAESEAITFFKQHGTQFETVEFVRLAAIVVSDEDRAEWLLALAINASEPEFRQLVERYSEDPASKRRNGQFLVIDEQREHSPGTVPHSDPGEREITPVAMALRQVGDVGLVPGPDGTFYVLKATELRMRRPEWNTALLQRVRTIMAWDRQAAAISELEQHLRQGARVQVNENVLRSVDIPVPDVGDTVDPTIHVND